MTRHSTPFGVAAQLRAAPHILISRDPVTSGRRLRDMVNPRRLAAMSLVLVLAGCGSVTAGHSAGGGTSSGPGTSPGDSRAVSVTFERMGGKTGRQQVSRFVAGEQPQPGTRPQQVHAVLAAASTPALRRLHLPPMPQYLCCDRYTYTVWIKWADGKHRVFRTADGLRKPPALRHLIAVLS
jgi:hypothetical protein